MDNDINLIYDRLAYILGKEQIKQVKGVFLMDNLKSCGYVWLTFLKEDVNAIQKWKRGNSP